MRLVSNQHKLKSRKKENGKIKTISKSYQNPYFASKKKNKINISKSLSSRVKTIIILLTLALLGGAWFLIYSDYFTIQDIKINGAGSIPTTAVEAIVREQIDENIFVLWPQKNIFLFTKKKLISSLEQKYSFAALEIRKKLPRSLIINYQEKEYTVIWQENNRYYYLDIDGAIINETSLEEINEKEYPLILNLSPAKITDNQITVPLNYLNYARELDLALKEHHKEEFKTNNFIIDSELNTVKVELDNGPQIFFNINENMLQQIEKLIVVKQEKIKDFFSKKIYIDLRYGTRVFYR